MVGTISHIIFILNSSLAGKNNIFLALADLNLSQIKDSNTTLVIYSAILISIIFILYVVAVVKRFIVKKRSDEKLRKEIEEHKKTSESLKISQERFHLAMQGSNDGLWDRDLLKNTVYYSERWKSMLGFTDDEFPNDIKAFEDRIHPDDYQMVINKYHDHINKKTVYYENKFRLKHKDGHYIWILDRGKAIFNKEGAAIRIVGTHTDITEKQKIEDELHQYQAHLQEKVRERTKELREA